MPSEKGCIRLHTGQLMPVVGLGTWLNVGNSVTEAIDAGYRHIDTAQMYGNEDQIGEAVQQNIKEGKVRREDLFITTKLHMTNMAPSNVRKETELSLKRLKTSYIDLYLIHFPVALSDEGMDQDPPLLWPHYSDGNMKSCYVDYMTTWKEMEKLVDDGLVKAIGLSNFNKEQVKRVCELGRIKPANLQVELHAWLQQYELVEFCEKKGIPITAYSPLGSPGRPPELNLGPNTPPLLDEPALKEIADRHKKKPAQVLLRNLIQRGLIVIPKSVTPERIKSNFEVMDFELSGKDMATIKGLNKNLRLFAFQLFGKANYTHPFFPWPIDFPDSANGTAK